MNLHLVLWVIWAAVGLGILLAFDCGACSLPTGLPWTRIDALLVAYLAVGAVLTARPDRVVWRSPLSVAAFAFMLCGWLTIIGIVGSLGLLPFRKFPLQFLIGLGLAGISSALEWAGKRRSAPLPL